MPNPQPRPATPPPWLRSAIGALVIIEQVIGVLLLAVVLGLMFTQVVARYVFAAPLFWSDELARFSYVWMSYIAAVALMARRSHIRIDLIDGFLGTRGRLFVRIVADLIVIGTCVFIVLGSWNWLMTTIRPRSPALGMPLIWLYGVVWFAFAAMALHAFINLVLLITGRQEPEQDIGFE